MENENLENETPKNEEEVVTPEVTPEEPVAEETPAEDSKELKSALAQKDHFRKKLEEAEAKLAKAATRPAAEEAQSPLDVEDYIDISASLDGLDPREKAYLAEQHKLSGKPLKEIREDEDFQLWQSAYQTKQEKENALKPNATQEIEDAPSSMLDKLRNASIAEKEEILKEAGFYKENKQGQARVDIGNKLPR